MDAGYRHLFRKFELHRLRNPQCPGNPLSPINLHFVIAKDGREIHQVVDANAVTAVGNKVD